MRRQAAVASPVRPRSGSGSYSGPNASASVNMNAPINETASFSQQVSVTVTTNPVGRSFTVDGQTYFSAQAFSWSPGSQHTIGTTTPQSGGTGVQFVWSGWNDGGAISHAVTAPGSTTTYTANFTTQYYLTTSAGNGGGTVSPASQWYNAGQNVGISASANQGYQFVSWAGSGSGSYSGSNASASVNMNAPINETASFSQQVSVTVTTNPVGRSFTVDGQSYSATHIFRLVAGHAAHNWYDHPSIRRHGSAVRLVRVE
ncbi:InlB B-repeat-containing protein [Paludibaculum fermentans]|uniref:Bacterial repeat domain-containing protein n=1 Tax=Paludibaculum fermentans TaxID=1473598 RepID=A0A7S7SNF6_PALFE|nr:hypothetical protein [Paludibaculum fermentans]QOY90516.1 hypothetical protein IRI77_11365 [Paludibaculum fermentans]